MAKKGKGEVETGLDMDLTAMIDCVFQLIIFFMLVSEISAADMERVLLPVALRAQKPDKVNIGDAKTITINVIQKRANSSDGQIKIRGASLGPEELDALLKLEALSAEWEKDPTSGQDLCTLQILIRADRHIQYKYVQQVFWKCIGHKIWKTSVAAIQKDAAP